MFQPQISFALSPYTALYGLIVPKNNLLRQINELVDFSFVYDELKDNYCPDNGRNAIDPLRMFKYLLMKSIFDLSDADLVERSLYDMSMKYFLQVAPEESVIDSSSLNYCRKLIEVTETKLGIPLLPKITEPLNLLKETVEDDAEQLRMSEEPDARVGHKSADSSFFGYKAHIAMSEERIITAAVVTAGEKSDGKQLQTLIEKSKAAGMTVNTVIGDTAYLDKDNLAYSRGNHLELVARLHPNITQGRRRKEDEFEFNKDAGLYVCKAGHMAQRKRREKAKKEGHNPIDTYFFKVELGKRCPFKEGCYKEGAKSKTYSVSIQTGNHAEQMAFQETERFKEKAKERYKIEAKNSELKNRHGYDVASSSGLVGMQLQGAMALFVVNLKRIMKLTG